MKAIATLASVLLFAAALAIMTAPAQAKTQTYVGTVTHVSTDNIKVKDSAGKEESFLIAPSFDQVFSSDGKTTYQMKNLKAGTHVKVLFHQTLGVRYADKIIVLGH
jgi:hypothetical protein